MGRGTLAVAALGLNLLCAGAARADAEPFNLEWRWTPGEVLHYRFVQTNDDYTEPFTPPRGRTYRRAFDTRHEVLSVKDGVITVLLRIEAVKLDYNDYRVDENGLPTHEEIHYDSARLEDREAQDSMTAIGLTALIGKEVSYQVRTGDLPIRAGDLPRPLGDFSDAIARAFEPIKQRDQAPGVTDAQRTADRNAADDAAKALLDGPLQMLHLLWPSDLHPPGRALKQGDTWTESGEIPSKDHTCLSEDDYTFEGVKVLRGDRCAGIRGRHLTGMRSSWGEAAKLLVNDENEAIFDLEKGVLVANVDVIGPTPHPPYVHKEWSQRVELISIGDGKK